MIIVDDIQRLLIQYATYINDLDYIIQQENWINDYLNEIAEDIYLAYQYRKELDQYKHIIQTELEILEQRLIAIAYRLKCYKPAYKYFENYFSDLLNL